MSFKGIFMPNDVSISDKSVGFFNSNGKLKNAEENAAAIKKIESAASETKVQAPSEPSSSTNFSQDTISKAIGSVRTRTESNADEIAKVINNDIDNLSAIESINAKETKVLKEIKSAKQSGDSAKEQELKQQFQKLGQERAELVENIGQDNNAVVTERVKSIRVGNQEKAFIKTDAVKAQKFENEDLDSEAGLVKALRSRDAEARSTKEQISNLETKRDEVKQVVDQARSDLGSLEESSIKSFSEASDRADKIAQDIRTGSSSVFESATVSKINQQVVRDLLT